MKRLDLSGQKFGRLTAIKIIRIEQTKIIWECKCDCGKKYTCSTSQLTNKISKSCGCLRKANLIGKKYGMLLVIGEGPRDKKDRRQKWICQCDCGSQRIVSSKNLQLDRTKDCGCKYIDRIKQQGIRRRKPQGVALENKVLDSYARNAKRKCLVFELNRDEFVKLMNGNCFYCDIPLSTVKRSSYDEIKYNGIDRLNNNMGYTHDNVVSCCKHCNYIKREKSLSEFIKIVRKIHDNTLHIKLKENIDDVQNE